MALILSRQLYASHYFEGSIGLTIVFQDPLAAGQGVWIVYVNRSRVDAFGGWFGGAKRAMVNARLPAGLREELDANKNKAGESLPGDCGPCTSIANPANPEPVIRYLDVRSDAPAQVRLI